MGESVRSWMVGLALLAAGPSLTGEIPVGETSQGIVFWHGHRIHPPFRVGVAFRVERDTVWTGPAINGLTLDSLREPDPPQRVGPADPTAFDPEQVAKAADLARRRAFQRSQAGESGVARLLAEEYRALGDLVDSVVIKSGTEVAVHWRGLRMPVGIRIGRLEESAVVPLDLRRIHRMEAAGTLSFLSRGGMLVVSSGHLRVPPGSFPRFLAEIDSLRAGLEPASSHLHGTMRDEVRHPEPLDSLRRRAR